MYKCFCANMLRMLSKLSKKIFFLNINAIKKKMFLLKKLLD